MPPGMFDRSAALPPPAAGGRFWSAEVAQSRLVEALAQLHHDAGHNRGVAGDPLIALGLGIAATRAIMSDGGEPDPLTCVYAALEELVFAVRADLMVCREGRC